MAGEKRTQDQEETLLSETVILLDIEGTTTSISFVKDTLFPYVRENLKKYIDAKWEDAEFKEDYEKLKEQAKKDEEDKVDGFVPITGATAGDEKESLMKNILWQMDCDRKTGALKLLQGHMWREAYNSGTVKAHIYEDVPKALEAWTNDSRKVYVYSSGSVEAQKLLFGHTVHGDLLKHFSGFFDTEVGAKQESKSYKNILSKIGTEPSNVIFLTDIVKEAAAAKEAGLSAIIVIREGNAALTEEERVAYTTVNSLLDLTFQSSTKRQKLEAAEPEDTVKKTTQDTVEPMDTSEDVEMSDVSGKKVEEAETKEPVSDETKKVTVDDQLSKDPPNSDVKMDESMVTDAKSTTTPSKEKVTESTCEKVDAKPSEVSTKQDTSETVQHSISGKPESTVTPAKIESDKPTVSEKLETVDATEKTVDAKTPSAATVNKKTDEIATTEIKTEGATKTAKETKPEDSKVDGKATDEGSQEKTKSNSIEDKATESTGNSKSGKEETKETIEEGANKSKTMETEKAKDDESVAKKELVASKETTKTVMEKPSENGDATATTNVDKIAAPTIKESETITSKTDINTETKDSPETKSEPQTTAETVNVKSPKTKETEETVAKSAEKSADASKQESSDKTTAEEADETKENASPDPEKKKLNGTTQNGSTDDKLQRNGLNEEPTKENVNNSSTSDSNASAQNGEAECSAEASTESIKVKKVVDSGVAADGAGEPDVVPPVVVAATS